MSQRLNQGLPLRASQICALPCTVAVTTLFIIVAEGRGQDFCLCFTGSHKGLPLPASQRRAVLSIGGHHVGHRC
jgi:hypothetical protein